MTAGNEASDVAARYLVHLTREAIQALARKIGDHVAAGLTDSEGFRERRTARHTAEFATYKRYVSDRRLRVVINNGLVLRELEAGPEFQGRVKDLLDWISKNYHTTGVWQAEFVQRGLLLKVIGALQAVGVSDDKVGPQVEALLWRVERYVRFVREGEDERRLGDEVRIRVLQVTPNTFIVCGKGRAKDAAKSAVRAAMRLLPEGYLQHPEESRYDYVVMIGPDTGGILRVRWDAPN